MYRDAAVAAPLSSIFSSQIIQVLLMLPFLTVAALARLIKTQEVSPVEVVEAHLERIERLNPQLHAFLTICHEGARRAARAAEHEIAHGAYRGSLHGIPCAVK